MNIMKPSSRQAALAARCVSWGLLALSVGFILTGIIREEHAVVMKKAINICLECIGID